MSIGAVAARTGKRPSSIRYYEQIGLLPPAARVSGRRVYGPETVRILAVIETGQRAGLPGTRQRSNGSARWRPGSCPRSGP
jgi:DNA-binding transcriptional MerR regulator